MQERDERVGSSTAELAAVLRLASVRTSTVTTGIATEPDRERRHTGTDEPPSATNIASARKAPGRYDGKRGERAADLLLALDQDLDPDGRLAAPGPKRADVHEDVRLRVGRAAAEDGSVALRGLERRRLPLLHVACRDHVVVPVQQHGRGPVGVGISPVRTGAVPGSSSAPKFSTPTSRSSPRIVSYVSRSAGRVCSGKLGSETDGIATSRARSSCNCGMSVAIDSTVGPLAVDLAGRSDGNRTPLGAASQHYTAHSAVPSPRSGDRRPR